MLLIQALSITLSERGLSRKRVDMFSAHLSHWVHVLKSLLVLIYLHQKPCTKTIGFRILDCWQIYIYIGNMQLAFYFLLHELSGKNLV